MNRTIFSTGILFGLLAVILGAFGAHGLEQLVDADAIQAWETGVKYQMYHALFLLVLAMVKPIPEAHKKWIFSSIVSGTILFSFSIYFLATNTLTSFNFETIGLITPVGGLLLIVGWVLLGIKAWTYFRFFTS